MTSNIPQTTNLNPTYIPANQGFDPLLISNMFMNNMMSQKLFDIFNKPMTAKSILGFMLILLANEIKTASISFFKYIISESHNLKSLLVSLYINRKSRNINPVPVANLYEIKNTYNLAINENFLLSLYKLIESDPSYKYSKESTSIEFIDNKKRIENVTISNIYHGDITIMCNINYKIDFATNCPINASINSVDDVDINNNKYDHRLGCLINYLNDSQKNVTYEAMIILLNYISDTNFVKNIEELKLWFKDGSIKEKIRSNKKLCDYIELCKKSDNDLYISYYKLAQLLSSYDNNTTTYILIVIRLIECINSSGIINMFCKKCIGSIIKVISMPLYNGKSIYSGSLDAKITCLNYKSFDNFQIDTNLVSYQNNLNKSIISLEFPLSYTKVDKINYIKLLDTSLSKNKSVNREVVKIYNLKLETNTTFQELDNPDYETWLEKKKMMEDSKSADGKVCFDISSIDIPSKKIKKEIMSKSVSTVELNVTFKTMDTLYLREADKKRLFCNIDMFKNKRYRMKELGLQQKLNILLYGIPGTGKSSTIQAVASYLEKDIYYLDLNNAVTNNDLQLMFEYVNKNVPDGGIIVIEDIDAMTDVVHIRDKQIDESVGNLIESRNSNLTLEYFLNVLQGTLTLDDSVFIVTTNHLEKIDPAFYRDGRFDVKIELKMCDRYQISCIFKKIMDREIEENVLNLIPENRYTPATIMTHIRNFSFEPNLTDTDIMKNLMNN